MRTLAASCVIGLAHGFVPIAPFSGKLGNGVQDTRGRFAIRSEPSMGMLPVESLDTISQLGIQLLAYSDEYAPTPSVTLTYGAIGATSAGVLALFGGLALLLGKPSTGKFELTEDESVAAGATLSIYDVSEADRVLTEMGTAGEVKRRQAALEAKKRYQQGRDLREVRDKTLAYAEFDFGYLAALLRVAGVEEGSVFLDMGSGTGKAVVAAGLLYPGLACARGVELLEGLHNMAKTFERKYQGLRLPKAPLEFVQADFCSDELDISDVDVVFAYSTKYATEGNIYLSELSKKLTELKPGARVITVDKRLRGPFTLVKTLEDPNGDLQLSTGFVWRRN